MNATDHFEDDDLALYAMHLLAQPEAAAVARQIAADPETRERFAQVRAELALFAEASLEFHPVPEAGLGRLMGRIAQDRIAQDQRVVPISTPAAAAMGATLVPPAKSTHRIKAAAGWIGWAIAACLVAVIGKLYHDESTLHQSLAAAQTQATQMSREVSDADRERDALKANVARKANRIQNLSGETEAATAQNEDLRSKVAGETGKLKEQTTLAAQAQRDRDAVQQTAAAEANQVARLAADAAETREIVAALTDRSALQVSLTKPKTHPAPAGHATYVASRGTLVFLASNLAPLKSNKVYQLWLLPASGSNPVPAGTFSPDAHGNASVIYRRFPQAVGAAGFAVTVENTGGAQTPTLPLVLAGKAA